MEKLEIKIGKRFILRNGLITEPIQKGSDKVFFHEAKVNEPQYIEPTIMSWTGNGRFLARTLENRYDIISEYKGD